MFGYIKPTKCSLQEKEQEIYKAVYCGLCHSQKKVSGQLSRLTLSYDFVLLALMQMLVNNETPTYQTLRCPSHPFGGCPAVLNSQTLDRCAALSVLLVYEGACDGIADEKGLEKQKARMLSLAATRFLKTTSKSFSLPTKEVREYLDALHRLEQGGSENTSPDALADIFGNLLAFVSKIGIEDDIMAFAISKMMYHIGKWIYLIDAADDYEEDLKRGRFNAFAPNGVDRNRLYESLNWELYQCEEILRKIPTGDANVRNIIRNILFTATEVTSQNILFPSKQTKGSATAHRI